MNLMPLFEKLDTLLIDLLQSLTDEQWQAQTVAKRWKIKDVAAHLLDGNLRGLSASRDHYLSSSEKPINNYQDLVDYINAINSSWTEAAKRLSPRVLITLLASTGQEYTAHLCSLDPAAPAIFSVAWAGEQMSTNAFHIAREYTEKFLHQQQIRDAIGDTQLYTKELFFPFIDTLMRALPHTFRTIDAPSGTTVSIEVTTPIDGCWTIQKNTENWQWSAQPNGNANATLRISPEHAWKLFTKSISPEDVSSHIVITGDTELGQHALHMVSVMA